MKNLFLLIAMALLVACSPQPQSDQSVSTLETVQSDKVNLFVGHNEEQMGYAETTANNSASSGGSGISGGSGLAIPVQPNFIPLVPVTIPNYPMPAITVCQPNRQCKVTYHGRKADGAQIILGAVTVTGQTYLDNVKFSLPPNTSSITASIKDLGSIEYEGEYIGTSQHAAPLGFKVSTMSTGAVSGGVLHCQRGLPCGEDPPDPNVGEEDYCLAVALYFQDEETAIFDKEIGEANEAVFSAVAPAPAVDPWSAPIAMPMYSPTAKCEFDAIVANASNPYGWSGLKNIGEGAGQMDAFDNLTGQRFDASIGVNTTPFDEYTGPNGVGNLLDEGGYGSANMYPHDLQPHAIDWYGTDAGRPLVLLSAANPLQGYGGYLLEASGAGNDDNNDGIREYSLARDIQENIGEPTSGGYTLHSSTTDIKVLHLEQTDFSGKPYVMILASGDHDTSVNPLAGPYEQSSAYDLWGGMELGLDVAIAEDQAGFPGTRAVRKTAEIFKRHDGSDFEGAYDMGGTYGTVANSVRLYMSKIAVCEDIEGYPLFFFGISEADDIHFNRSVAPQTPAVIESGFAAMYDKNAGEYGQFVEIDDVNTNTLGVKLSTLGLGSFLNDAQGARDIKCKRNFLKDVLIDVGLTPPNVADFHLVIAKENAPTIVYEWDGSAFNKVTGSTQPDTEAMSAHAINTRLKVNGNFSNTANWEIPQSVIGATPYDETSGVVEDNSMIEVENGQYDPDGSTMSSQHPTLASGNATFFELFLVRRYDTGGVVVRYDPGILTGCASDNTACSPIDRSKLRLYIKDDTP